MKLKPGNIIQIKDNIERKCFSTCLATISEVYSWGVLAYIIAPGETFISAPRRYYLRLNNSEFVHLARSYNAHYKPNPEDENYGIVMDVKN